LLQKVFRIVDVWIEWVLLSDVACKMCFVLFLTKKRTKKLLYHL
jgi:hypothetical protein